MVLGRDVNYQMILQKKKKIGDNWKKRQRYVHRCKEAAAWKRWIHEYLIALRERHNIRHKEKPVKIKISDVVIIKGDQKNRKKWKIKIVQNIFTSKDNIIRSI